MKILCDELRKLDKEAKARLGEAARRSPRLRAELQEMYEGRCQIGDFDSRARYNADVVDTHHIQYISRGGDDALDNIVVICPNHHRAIHATGAVFDYHDLSFVFGKEQREKLAINFHLKTNV